MNSYNHYEINLDDKTIGFRLTASACMEIETKENKSVIDFINTETVSMCVTMLQHMRSYEDKSFDKGKAKVLFDELIDNGWSIKRIITDIIYETLVVSGFLEKEELEEIKKTTAEMKAKMKTKAIEVLNNI